MNDIPVLYAHEGDPMGQVYVVGGDATPLVKIGITTGDLRQRVSQIAACSPLPLRLLWDRPGNRAVEKRIHRVLADRRRHAEWFDFSDVGDPVALVEAAYQEQQPPS